MQLKRQCINLLSLCCACHIGQRSIRGDCARSSILRHQVNLFSFQIKSIEVYKPFVLSCKEKITARGIPTGRAFLPIATCDWFSTSCMYINELQLSAYSPPLCDHS